MEIRSLVTLDCGRLLVLPALKRRLLTKISSVAYWFLVQISPLTSAGLVLDLIQFQCSLRQLKNRS